MKGRKSRPPSVASGARLGADPTRQSALAIERAGALYGLGRWDEAEQLCRQVLAGRADYFDALFFLGIIAAQTARMEEAARLLGRAVLIKPGDAGVHNNYGNVLLTLGRREEALESYSRALRISPGFAEAHNNRGNALKDLSRFAESLESYEHALQINPEFAEAHNNRGLVLCQMRRFTDALESYEHALAISPGFADALCNRGDALHALGRCEDAIASYDRALAIAPNLAAAHNNRGTALHDLHRLDEALESYGRALQVKADFPEAHNNRGNTLQDLYRMPEALECYERAIGLKPDYADAYYNRGNALARMNMLDGALESFTRGLILDPDSKWLHGARLFTKARLCDWSDWAAERGALTAAIESGKRAALPFQVLALTSSEALQRQAAQIYVCCEWPANPLLGAVRRRSPDGKIRVGYFSADYRMHPVAILCAGLFEAHDRTRFEITAFSFGPNARDDVRQRMELAFDRFLDVGRKSDLEIAQIARQAQLDIAVDLTGLTEHSRTGALALRVAPLQVNYLGYPGTMGAGFIDYMIADEFVVPPESRRHYSEQMIYLDCFQANDDRRPIGAAGSRREAGLPDEGFVFCSFNNSYKINPIMFDVWCRLLHAVPGSVLWLVPNGEAACENLRREAGARGIEAQRLIFARRQPYAEHLGRLKLADLFLDTLPFNAGTTASDALWAGLPVLTCAGEAFAARMAGSLLQAVGLPELITHNLDDYERLALRLAREPERLAELRATLAAARHTAALFDTRRFCRHLEAAYTEIWARHQRGEAPSTLWVAPPAER